MATQKQIAANRRNALKSTGPRTPAGRAAVRLNALKHGGYSRASGISVLPEAKSSGGHVQYTPWPPDGSVRWQRYPAFGTVLDVEDRLWVVRQIRRTKHGFPLLFGTPAPAEPAELVRLPKLIPTKALIDFWHRNRTNFGPTFDLPAGRTTLKRVRYRFGFHMQRDLSAFWHDRIEDLKNLSAREFAERHHISFHRVEETRFKILGRTARPLGWWKTPEILAILRAGMSCRQIGQKLGIGLSHASRLRKTARLDPLPPNIEL